MADNFDLRKFLTENKLTKNTQLLSEAVTLNGKPVDINSIEIDGIDTNDYPDFVDAYITYAEYEDGTPLTEDELMSLEEENYGIVGELIFDRQLYTEGDGEEEEADMFEEGAPPTMQAGFDMVNLEARKHKEIMRVANKLFPEFGGDLQNLKPLSSQQRQMVYQNLDPANLKETVKENKMTQRDKYLTRLVENALGLYITEDDNVDYTMGRHDDPNQLPNPAPQLTIPEGEDMVEEKPLPKYENIEKLMQEIDKSTDEAAHKYKMDEMKRVADMLEKKCTALEEGDNAEHIDQKKLKQMKKDVMSLRKNIEKMEKLGEKKFTKKETKAEMKEGFDLRKFLVENKLTENSRVLGEEAQSTAYEKLVMIVQRFNQEVGELAEELKQDNVPAEAVHFSEELGQILYDIIDELED